MLASAWSVTLHIFGVMYSETSVTFKPMVNNRLFWEIISLKI